MSRARFAHRQRPPVFTARAPDCSLSRLLAFEPNYFHPLGTTGILLEVERGKTTTNNMDLLDFWKCHICGVACYLFLLVSKALQHDPEMTPKRESSAVQHRLAEFFNPSNYTNVRGCASSATRRVCRDENNGAPATLLCPV